MEEQPQQQPPHVAIFATPGMGHLIPLVELAKKLAYSHQFSFTFLIPLDAPPSIAQRSVFDSLPSSIKHIFLPPVNVDDLSEETRIETRVSLTVLRSLSSLREEIKLLVSKTKLAAMIFDAFATDGFAVAKEFNVSPYVFFPSPAMCVSFGFYLPKLDKMVSGEYRDLPEPVTIPGCVPIDAKDLVDPLQDRKNEAYKWFLHHSSRYALAEGILVNSFMELEAGAFRALQEAGKPPVYPVGPLVKMGSNPDGSGLETLKWLDQQPSGSVLFVSFGSGGTLSHNQMIELAMGLEMSGKRFLWVVKSPNDKAANGLYFNVDDQRHPVEFLPEGFMEKTKEQGLVVPSWAPQAQILGHGSTGGFLSHCGWNSTLEGVVNGVPMLAWPLFAEQKMNAVMLTDDIKVALRPKGSENGAVKREEVARVVKILMEGEEGTKMRERMKSMKEAARKAISEDGSSTVALSEVALKWKSQMAN